MYFLKFPDCLYGDGRKYCYADKCDKIKDYRQDCCVTCQAEEASYESREASRFNGKMGLYIFSSQCMFILWNAFLLEVAEKSYELLCWKFLIWLKDVECNYSLVQCLEKYQPELNLKFLIFSTFTSYHIFTTLYGNYHSNTKGIILPVKSEG